MTSKSAYLLRGGIIGTVLSLGFAGLSLLFTWPEGFIAIFLPGFLLLRSFSDCFSIDFDSDVFMGVATNERIFSCGGILSNDMAVALFILAVTICIYFILGAVIGLLYGKVMI